MNILDELALKYKTDKASYGHNYTRIYDKLFDKFRELPINLLEIGIAEGHSLKLWYEYFPLAAIYGVDINSECKQYENDRTKIFIGDQSDKDFLNSFGSFMFDIIIDDGGHRGIMQIASLEVLFNFLKPNGLYIIEDLTTSFVEENDCIRDVLKQKVDLVLGVKEHNIKSIHFYRRDLSSHPESSSCCIIIKE